MPQAIEVTDYALWPGIFRSINLFDYKDLTFEAADHDKTNDNTLSIFSFHKEEEDYIFDANKGVLRKVNSPAIAPQLLDEFSSSSEEDLSLINDNTIGSDFNDFEENSNNLDDAELPHGSKA